MGRLRCASRLEDCRRGKRCARNAGGSCLADEMRGCSLALFPLPIVLLNSSDSPLGRVFSLLHELTHLARNESALCDISEQKGIELFCNHVAGGILVPRAPLLAYAQERGATNVTQWTNDELVELRNRFRASREVVLRRLLLIHKTSRAFYQRKREEFLKEYADFARTIGRIRPVLAKGSARQRSSPDRASPRRLRLKSDHG